MINENVTAVAELSVFGAWQSEEYTAGEFVAWQDCTTFGEVRNQWAQFEELETDSFVAENYALETVIATGSAGFDNEEYDTSEFVCWMTDGGSPAGGEVHDEVINHWVAWFEEIMRGNYVEARVRIGYEDETPPPATAAKWRGYFG